MTYIDPAGVLGAKRATWRSVNPRELLQRILTDNPDEDEDCWRELFWKEIEDDEDYLKAITDYWLDNTLRSFRLRTPARKTRIKEAKTEVCEETTRKVRKLVAKRVIALLTMVAPNGKELGECTGARARIEILHRLRAFTGGRTT